MNSVAESPSSTLVDLIKVSYDPSDDSFNIRIDPSLATGYSHQALLQLTNVLINIRSDILGHLNQKKIKVGLIADIIEDSDTVGVGFITYPTLTDRLDASELLKSIGSHVLSLSDQAGADRPTVH